MGKVSYELIVGIFAAASLNSTLPNHFFFFCTLDCCLELLLPFHEKGCGGGEKQRDIKKQETAASSATAYCFVERPNRSAASKKIKKK